MTPMEIMMEMTDFRRLRLGTKEERTLFFSTRIQCLSQDWLSDLADSRLAQFFIRTVSSQFARLDTSHASFDSSKQLYRV